MAAAKRLKPFTFFGRVPHGTTTVELTKILVKSFSKNELGGVQDFTGGKYEVFLKTRAAVERFLQDPVVEVKGTSVTFEYRGTRAKMVRVFGYSAEHHDVELASALEQFGKIVSVTRESVTGFPTVTTGIRRVKIEMKRAVPNFLDVIDATVQCEYEGVVRVCRKCGAQGHMGANCETPQCVRCGAYGHETCEAACPKCGEDHDMRACKKRTFVSIVGEEEENEQPPVVWEQPKPAVSQAATTTEATEEKSEEPVTAVEEVASASLETSAEAAGPVDEVPPTQETEQDNHVEDNKVEEKMAATCDRPKRKRSPRRKKKTSPVAPASTPRAAVIVQGRISGWCPVARGVRQGCPLSPLLYVIAIEPLLQRLAADTRVKRTVLPVGPPAVPVFGYADDITIVVPDVASAARALEITEQYCEASGARLNKHKSAVMPLRDVRPPEIAEVPSVSETRMLGFYFNREGPSARNWEHVAEKVETKTADLGRLRCPITAQATIIRTLLIAIISFSASILEIPASMKKRVEKSIYRFLWQGAPEKIRRVVVKQPRLKGGLGIPDLDALARALHVQWTLRAVECDFTQQPLPHTAPRAGTPLAFYSAAAADMNLIRATFTEPPREIALKAMLSLLTPALLPHLDRELMTAEKPTWKYLTAHFLDARRASFMWRFARGILLIKRRTFVSRSSGLVDTCPFCGTAETSTHIFQDCVIPAALLERLRDLFGLPGIPFQTIRYFNPMPGEARNQFALALAEISYQVWVARCHAAYSGRIPDLMEVKNKIRKELWFHLQRERRHLGRKKFCEEWRPMIIFEECGEKISIKY
ncbi:hypothetical protein V5799_017498 [Amblyomma americanum]|uniref:CCHC-type domain-containing protein n=1 Tax=Amblyomma americanum TaxID=6943 RepID=A0AAQ4F339_AMBAM